MALIAIVHRRKPNSVTLVGPSAQFPVGYVSPAATAKGLNGLSTVITRGTSAFTGDSVESRRRDRDTLPSLVQHGNFFDRVLVSLGSDPRRVIDSDFDSDFSASENPLFFARSLLVDQQLLASVGVDCFFFHVQTLA